MPRLVAPRRTLVRVVLTTHAALAVSGCAAGSGSDAGDAELDALVGRNAFQGPPTGPPWADLGATDATLADASANPGPPGLGGAVALPDPPEPPDAAAAPGTEPAPPTMAPTMAPPTMAPTMAPCVAETCNGRDDDCNGVVDDQGACGPWVERQCRLVLGWADGRDGPAGTSPAWGPCPQLAQGNVGDNLRCDSTGGDGFFLNIDLAGNVNDDDQLGVALLCEDAAAPDVAIWTQTHCALFLGHADNGDGAPEGSPTWGACPDSVHSNAGPLRCTSTGYDAQFRALNLSGDVDDNDDVGVAWICRDPADAARAAAVQAAVEVFFGQADENLGPPDGSPTWGSCPGAPNVARGELRCTGTGGDGRFHRFRMEGDVDGNDDLGLALKRRRVP